MYTFYDKAIFTIKSSFIESFKLHNYKHKDLENSYSKVYYSLDGSILQKDMETFAKIALYTRKLLLEYGYESRICFVKDKNELQFTFKFA